MKKTLIKCGWLVTQDPAIGDFTDGELLIQGDRVLAAGKSLDAAHDDVIDASDMIVMPGLINGHIHVWQCGLRGIGSEWMGPDYHANIHANIATKYGPRDNYLGNLVGALTQIDSGVTTAIDFCHNLKSLEMAEAAIDGLEESGIRAVFAHGTAKPPAAPGETPFTHVPHPRDRIEALRKGRMASNDQRVTLAMAILGPHYGTQEVFETDVRLAREFGLFSTTHATKPNDKCISPRGYLALAKAGLLGPDHNIVHGNYIDDEELKAIADCGATVTATVLVELHGHAPDPLVMRMRAVWAPMPSHRHRRASALRSSRGDMLAGEYNSRRAAFGPTAAGGAAPLATQSGPEGRPLLSTMPVRCAAGTLEWATIGNAQARVSTDKVGRLSPGMKSRHHTMLGARILNISPYHVIHLHDRRTGRRQERRHRHRRRRVCAKRQAASLALEEKLLSRASTIGTEGCAPSALRAMDEANFKAQCRLSGRKDTTMNDRHPAEYVRGNKSTLD